VYQSRRLKTIPERCHQCIGSANVQEGTGQHKNWLENKAGVRFKDNPPPDMSRKKKNRQISETCRWRTPVVKTSQV
jgi:hypothetical protein